MDMKGDGQLLREFVAGGSSAFEELVARHQGMVLGVCRRVTNDAEYSEDAAQATFLLLATKADKLRSHPSIAGWLHRAAVNVARTAHRSNVRRKRREEVAMSEAEIGENSALEQKETFREMLDDALERLPDQDRECLVLHYIEGVSQADLAQQLGLKDSALSMRLTRARDRLRGLLRRLGLPLTGGAIALLLGAPLTAEAGAGFTAAVVGAGVQVQTVGLAGVTSVSSQAVLLTKGVLKAMIFRKLQMAAVFAAGFVLLGAVAYTQTKGAAVQPQPEPWLAQTTGAPAPKATPKPKSVPVAPLDPAAIKKWGQADILFIGILNRVQAGPVGMSMPPLRNHRLFLNVTKVLRGDLKVGQNLVCNHSVRQRKVPNFPEGKTCIVAASYVRKYYQARMIEEATDKTRAAAAMAAMLPLGWRVSGGELVCPWASLGKKAWPAGAASTAPYRCAKTGRPALLLGAGVDFMVEKVAPKVAIKWTNPDGDGEYRITVTNNTDNPVDVPALINVDGKIQWKESLLILCQKKTYVIPGAKGVSGAPMPTTLKPGEGVSTIVNALALKGPQWPRGGYRIEFQFCLGEKSQTQSFYYMSRHHDKLRNALK